MGEDGCVQKRFGCKSVSVDLQFQKAEVVLKSKAGVISGFRMWHFFAIGILGSYASATPPPTCVRDMVLFVGVFVNAGAAMNYSYDAISRCKVKRPQH